MRIVLLTAALTIAGAGAGNAASSMSLAAMARIVDIAEPAISPDAQRVAFIVVTQDPVHDSYHNVLDIVDVRSGRVRTIVRGQDVAVPRWSPDGTRLAYLARMPEGTQRQLFVRTQGGVVAMLTHSSGDVIDAEWSPDGRKIAFVAADPQDLSPYFFAGDNDYTATSLTPPDHLWIVAATGGSSRRLTRGSWTIAPTDPGGIFSPQIAWTHDGHFITFTRVENTFSGDDERSTLWQADIARGVITKVTEHAEFEESPSYSPDGSHMVYWYPRDGDYNAENTVRMRSGGDDVALVPDLDRNIASSQWLPDGQILLCGSDGTRTLFWRVGPEVAVRPLLLGEIHPVCDPYSSATFDSGSAAAISANGTIAFVATSAASARELYELLPGSASPRRLTHYNDFLARIAKGTMSELRWIGPDGFAEDGVVTTPPNARIGAKYPVVLLIHGGPGLASARDFVYEQWPLAQMLAAGGYVVFQPNYRGSDNLGNAYMTAIVRNTVAGPSADIMAGLAQLEQHSNVDASRVAVSGWSYGGELTSWLIGHYHQWRAAVSGAAVNSEFDEYNLSTSNVQDRYPLGASPYAGDGERIYRENSPITYYAQITTPTLIWGTTLDPVVPITQSYALYHALHENRVPVRFAVFPATTHGPDGPRQAAALTRLWLDWLARYLR